MGGNCNSCCANVSEDSELPNPDMMKQQQLQMSKENPTAGNRRSTDFKNKGALGSQGIHPVISRSGQHFDFKSMKGDGL